MKILVCVKHVPSTDAKIKIAPDGKSLEEAGVKMIISPYDEFALEEALRVRDATQGGEVVLLCAGPEAAQSSLRHGLAMGADRAILICDARFRDADALVRARALAAAIRAESPDLIFAGKYGVGRDEGQTGPALAEVLDLPHAGAVEQLEIAERTFTAHRAVEGAFEILEGTLPAVITWEKTKNDPRLASLKGIVAAKKKPMEIKTPGDLGIDETGLDAPSVVWESLELPPPRATGRRVEGEPAQMASELVRLLREEAKVI